MLTKPSGSNRIATHARRNVRERVLAADGDGERHATGKRLIGAGTSCSPRLRCAFQVPWARPSRRWRQFDHTCPRVGSREPHMGQSERRVVLITGGASGIGFAIVRRFLADGCRVAFVARTAEHVARALDRLGRDEDRLIGETIDVTRQDDLADFIGRIRERWDEIGVLVNNAGISPREATRLRRGLRRPRLRNGRGSSMLISAGRSFSCRSWRRRWSLSAMDELSISGRWRAVPCP